MSQPYVPDVLPLNNLDPARLIRKIGPANAALARYDGLLQSIINPTVMLSPLTNREAVLSSRIEGTQATVDEVLEFEAGLSPDTEEKAQDIQEIVNYRKTLLLAKEELVHRPLTLVLIRQMHEVLMDSVRGANKKPGLFRTDQNWIGFAGSTREQATFVPPSPLQLLDHLQVLEKYFAYEEIDALVQTAIVHAQFELLHPFLDGNGRIGRLLIPLFLYQKKMLATPSFYLSDYLESHRETYYGRLQAVSRNGDWTGWIEFFLEAVVWQADVNIKRVQDILLLYGRMKNQVSELTNSRHAVKILDTLFSHPIFSTGDFSERSGVPKQTAMPFIKTLTNAGILHVLREQRGRKGAVYAFRELLNCAEGRTVL